MAIDLKNLLPILIEQVGAAEEAVPSVDRQTVNAVDKTKIARRIWEQFGPILKPALEGLLKKGLDKILHRKKGEKKVEITLPEVALPEGGIIPQNPTVLAVPSVTPTAALVAAGTPPARVVAGLRIGLMLVEERDPSIPVGNPEKKKGGLVIASHARFNEIRSGESAAQTKARFHFDVTPVDQHGQPFEPHSPVIPRGPEGEPIVKVAWEVDGQVNSELISLTSYHDADAGHTPVLVADWNVAGRHGLRAWAYYEAGTPWTLDGKRIESEKAGPFQFDE